MKEKSSYSLSRITYGSSFYLFLFIALSLYACAQIVPLSGGEKDITPPQEIKSTPTNGSINFSAKSITIEFDEFIRLQNLSSQLIISPLLDENPEIKVKGKRLVIRLPDSLSANTTYSFNFGNAITDITENNEIPNYKYVFSTGDYLDSISYSGRVVNAFDLTPKEKVYVLLYDQFYDSIPLKEKPRYISISDKEGNFSITNIANGNYKLFALTDINSNYIYDLPNEEIAFKKELVQMDTSSSENIVHVFNEDNDIQYVKRAENIIYGKVDFELNLPTKNLTVSPNVFFKKQWYIEEKNEAGDSLTHWVFDIGGLKDITYVVRDERKVIDTVTISIIPPEKFKDSSLTLTSNVAANFDLNKNLHFLAERPVKTFFSDSIQLLEDSISVPFKCSATNRASRKFELEYAFKENSSYHLFIPPKTFTDIYGLTNDTISHQFKTKKERDYGNIFLTVTPNFSSNYIVQLHKGKNIIHEDSYNGETKITYNYIPSGAYQIKLIVDENGNKKWDTGNYLEHLQPEQVIFYDKEIKIRANWDNELIWNVKL